MKVLRRVSVLQQFRGLSAHLHKLTPTKKVALSGFANGHLDPQAFETFWRDLLQHASIDVVLFQDGIGARKLELSELSFYLTAMRNATQTHQREFKIMARFRFQLTVSTKPLAVVAW